jgi:hypothetical protein
MTEREKPKQFEKWAESLDELENLEGIIDEAENEDRQWRETSADDKLVEITHEYATSLGNNVTQEQLTQDENERNRYLNAYRESLRYTSGNQVNDENRKKFTEGLVNHNAGKTLDALVALEVNNKDKPVLRATMEDDEIKVYMAYAKVAGQKSLLKSVEEHGLAGVARSIWPFTPTGGGSPPGPSPPGPGGSVITPPPVTGSSIVSS